MILKFNDILRKGNVDPKHVRLVRHAPNHKIHRAVYEAALAGDDRFREYQEIQGAPKVQAQFKSAKYIAGFIADPMTKDTVFVGIWELKGERTAPKYDPFNVWLRPSTKAFVTVEMKKYHGYRGRLIVDWRSSQRAWVQHADRQDKTIEQIRSEQIEQPFPGFLKLIHQLDLIETMPVDWTAVLRHTKGIYLLVHKATGRQYVGGTYGEDGFLGRWRKYIDGHGGNVAMKELGAKAKDYNCSILEIMGSDVMEENIAEREAIWKRKLGTRVKGLNRN